MTTRRHTRCRACGKPLEPGRESLIKIALGRITSDDGVVEFDEDETAWGYMHRRCFAFTVGDPSVIESKGPSKKKAA